METFTSLINHCKGRGVLKNKGVFEAFTKIDRKDFVPHELRDLAYEDSPLPIGQGQTISQPFTVLFMLELLDVHRGEKVLDVGSGSCYTTALLAEIVGLKGKVIGVELVPELVAFGKKNVAGYHFSNLEIHQAGKALGIPEEAPYDKILVSAAAEEVPKELLQQLRAGGSMVIPIRDDIWKIEKQLDDTLKIEKYNGFTFVPLIEND